MHITDSGGPEPSPVDRAVTSEGSFLGVADAYDLWSGIYDTYDNPMVFAASRVIDRLAERVAGRDVVELGCGTGRNLARLKAGGAATLIGCDLSEGMLARARARDPEIHLVRHDLSRPLPLADRAADLVLFCLTLEHVQDLVPPLREARRALRPGGEVAIIEIHPALALDSVAAHFRLDGRLVEMPCFPHPLPAYDAAFAAAGLRLVARREWAPRDLPGPLPDKVLKRGPDAALLVEFALCL